MTKEEQPKRQHKATYAADKINGGYLVRVLGPYANRFSGREVPVIRKDDTEDTEILDKLIWVGVDNDHTDPDGTVKKGTGKPVALYSFKPHPKDEKLDEIAF